MTYNKKREFRKTCEETKLNLHNTFKDMKLSDEKLDIKSDKHNDK